MERTLQHPRLLGGNAMFDVSWTDPSTLLEGFDDDDLAPMRCFVACEFGMAGFVDVGVFAKAEGYQS